MKTFLRVHRAPLSPKSRARLEGFVADAFERLRTRVDKVRVTLRDINGPKGGVDILCRVEVASKAGHFVIDERSDRPMRALMGACLRATRTMWRRIDKLRSRRRARRQLAAFS